MNYFEEKFIKNLKGKKISIHLKIKLKIYTDLLEILPEGLLVESKGGKMFIFYHAISSINMESLETKEYCFDNFFDNLKNKKISLYLLAKIKINGFLKEIFSNGFLITEKDEKKNIFIFKQSISSISIEEELTLNTNEKKYLNYLNFIQTLHKKEVLIFLTAKIKLNGILKEISDNYFLIEKKGKETFVLIDAVSSIGIN